MIRAAGAVIYNPEKGFLLIKQKTSGDWELSKGRLEKDESWEEGAAREIKEETGLNVRFLDGFSHDEKYNVHGDPKQSKTVRYFLATTDDEPVLSSEHTAFLWLKPEDALKKITHQSRKGVLQKAIDFLKL